eukprot:6208233-Pleurochrysis_carterae.AAC.2
MAQLSTKSAASFARCSALIPMPYRACAPKKEKVPKRPRRRPIYMARQRPRVYMDELEDACSNKGQFRRDCALAVGGVAKHDDEIKPHLIERMSS